MICGISTKFEGVLLLSTCSSFDISEYLNTFHLLSSINFCPLKFESSTKPALLLSHL